MCGGSRWTYNPAAVTKVTCSDVSAVNNSSKGKLHTTCICILYIPWPYFVDDFSPYHTGNMCELHGVLSMTDHADVDGANGDTHRNQQIPEVGVGTCIFCSTLI